MVPRRNQVRLPPVLARLLSPFRIYPSDTAREVKEVVHRTRGRATRICGRSPSPPARSTDSAHKIPNRARKQGDKRSDPATASEQAYDGGRISPDDYCNGSRTTIRARLAVLEERILCETGVWKRTVRVRVHKQPSTPSEEGGADSRLGAGCVMLNCHRAARAQIPPEADRCDGGSRLME